MKNSFVMTAIVGAIALTLPNAVSAAESTGFGSAHATVNAPTGSVVGQSLANGRARPVVISDREHEHDTDDGHRAVPGFLFAYDPFWYGPGWGLDGYAYPDVMPGENRGGLRLEVTPKTAQVLVDGYYAGVVDDFDGYFQHLDLAPGGHRIEVRQAGFKPLTFQVYVQPGRTTDYKAALAPARRG